MIVEPIFTNFIASEFLDIDNSAIERECYKIVNTRAKTPHYQYGITYEDSQTPVFKPLFDAIVSKLAFMHEHLEMSKEFTQEIYSVWMNYNESPITTAPHSHAPAFLSGVYYVKSSQGSGMLEFINPVTEMPWAIGPGTRLKNNAYNSDKWGIVPEAGKLIIFPSWLMHYVCPRTDNEDRISIAFNSKIIPYDTNL
jgi:uncharacterized protein (TIGR02466 family)